jgi:hypothetical protein
MIAGSALSAVAVFLPWFRVVVMVPGRPVTSTVAGEREYRYLLLVILVAVIVLATQLEAHSLALRHVRLPNTGLLLTAATGAALVMTLLAVQDRPYVNDGLGAAFPMAVGWSYGGFVAMIAAAVAFGAAAAGRRDPR